MEVPNEKEATDKLFGLADSIFSCGSTEKIIKALMEAYDMGMMAVVLKYDQAATSQLELANKYLALSDKYAAAMGRIAELEALLRAERAPRLGERSGPW